MDENRQDQGNVEQTEAFRQPAPPEQAPSWNPPDPANPYPGWSPQAAKPFDAFGNPASGGPSYPPPVPPPPMGGPGGAPSGWGRTPPPGGYPYAPYGGMPGSPYATPAGWPPMETPEQRRERNHRFYVKKCGGRVGAFLLIQWGVAQGIAAVLVFLFYLIQFASGTQSADWQQFTTSMLPVLLADVLMVCVGPSFLRVRLDGGLLRKGQAKAGMTLLGMGACGGCAAAAVGVSSLFLLLFDALGMEMPGIEIAMPDRINGAWVATVLYISLFGPILEELIFRGYLLKYLRRYGDRFAILMTAILFTVFHMNPSQLVLPMLTGLLLAFLTVRTGSLWPAIVCHILNNTMSTVSSALSDMGVIWGEWLYFAYLVLGIVCLVAFCIRYRGQIQSVSAGDTTVLATRGKLKCALSAGSNIALFILYGFSTGLLLLMAAFALF